VARKTGIVAGILALILTFFQEIPIYPPNDWVLNLRLLVFDNLNIYIWGYLSNNQALSPILLGSPENLVALALWLILLLIGVSSVFASTTKAKIGNSLKLYKINIVLTGLLLVIFGTSIILLVLANLSIILEIIGYGYYILIIVLILNIIALKKITSLKEED